MATPPIPVKTAEGLAELSSRKRGLSQRHRTLLLLVDGRRTERQVRAMGRKAGANDSCFGDLLALGLISVSQPPDVPVSTVPIPRSPFDPEDEPLHVDIPIDDVEEDSHTVDVVLAGRVGSESLAV